MRVLGRRTHTETKNELFALSPKFRLAPPYTMSNEPEAAPRTVRINDWVEQQPIPSRKELKIQKATSKLADLRAQMVSAQRESPTPAPPQPPSSSAYSNGLALQEPYRPAISPPSMGGIRESTWRAL